MPNAMDACTPYTKTPSELPRPIHSVNHQHLERLFCIFGHDELTSDRIPNLSFRRSIQTFSPDLRKRITNVIESRDIGDTVSGRTHVSLRNDIHVDNGNCASEIGAQSFD